MRKMCDSKCGGKIPPIDLFGPHDRMHDVIGIVVHSPPHDLIFTVVLKHLLLLLSLPKARLGEARINRNSMFLLHAHVPKI